MFAVVRHGGMDKGKKPSETDVFIFLSISAEPLGTRTQQNPFTFSTHTHTHTHPSLFSFLCPTGWYQSGLAAENIFQKGCLFRVYCADVFFQWCWELYNRLNRKGRNTTFVVDLFAGILQEKKKKKFSMPFSLGQTLSDSVSKRGKALHCFQGYLDLSPCLVTYW